MSSNDRINAVSRSVLFHVAHLSYFEFLTNKWRDVCRGLKMPIAQFVIDEIRTILHPWAAQLIGERCDPPSYVSADGFPAEMSVSWHRGRPELRILFESIGPEPTAHSRQEAGRALTRRLAGRPRVSIQRYLDIEDLFLVPDPQPNRPTVWHSLAWRPRHLPTYKVYLNPQAHGVDRAYEVVSDAMHRLGLSSAWQPVLARADELTQRGHEVEFLALDLDSSAKARLKIYFRHHEMPLTELNTVASLARDHDAARAAHASRVIYGRETTVVTNQPMTCLAFRPGTPGPEEANIYLRLPDNVRNDAEARDRITTLMQWEGIDPQPYTNALAHVSPAPPESTAGLQELLSYRTTAPDQPADLGLYLRFSTYNAA